MIPGDPDSTTMKKVRVAYLVNYPIQYQAPMLRRIAQEQDIELTVFFGSDFSAQSYKNAGFGVVIRWDVPLLEGYRHEFLPALRDRPPVSFTSPMNYGFFSRLRGFDVLWVHGYASINALHAMFVAKALGIPVLLRAESWLRDRSRSGMKLMMKRLFFAGLTQFVDGVLPIGRLNAEYWKHYLGEDFPASLMPYAVDNAYFQSQTELARTRRQELQEELKLDTSRPVILFASKLLVRKRCMDLLEAYRNLCAGGGEPIASLVIVGDGEERAQLERRAAEYGLTGVRFCGFRNQSELPRFFDLADVFVLPSRHEPWGLIVNEAMNAGLAVIVSDEVGCQADLVTDGVEGCIFRAGDVEALTAALRNVLRSPETAGAMGRAGLKRIEQWSFEEDVRGLREGIARATRRMTE